jgi:hypothetical protein
LLAAAATSTAAAAAVAPWVQSLKDAIVVTAGGAETLPFLASFCVLPASLAFFVLYGKLVRRHVPTCVSGLPAHAMQQQAAGAAIVAAARVHAS